ncbi:hypothetical protein Ddc_16715 [Ditylenchus destructor]|nr:hypothetical protein Ddc_16715 [Ditylenchus destructor]
MIPHVVRRGVRSTKGRRVWRQPHPPLEGFQFRGHIEAAKRPKIFFLTWREAPGKKKGAPETEIPREAPRWVRGGPKARRGTVGTLTADFHPMRDTSQHEVSYLTT